jgi:hypothetical protein
MRSERQLNDLAVSTIHKLRAQLGSHLGLLRQAGPILHHLTSCGYCLGSSGDASELVHGQQLEQD